MAVPTVSAHPYEELTVPVGKPRGYVMVVHGGGWISVGKNAVLAVRPWASRFNRAGYATLNIDYRPGGKSLADVIASYDRLRRAVGPAVPICVLGGSAGGHLVLMLATRRHQIACVISEAGPTVLASLPPSIYPLAAESFGNLAGGLPAYSPALLPPPAKHTHVLLVYATNDPLVPWTTVMAYKRCVPSARLVTLTPGDTPYIHSTVERRQVASLGYAERRFVRQSLARG
ncbi:MAG: hypothetical protein QOH76_2342 [Thermoleophilaceae bacterium]|jgi:acetyl esterase/lipase|nr:hypothetical protein [Thermoleophilaceae bacterium]